MAQLPDTAVVQPQMHDPLSNNGNINNINNNNNNNNITNGKSEEETKVNDNNPTKKDENKNSKHKVIKIKILMIRQASPFFIVISTSSTILQLKQEIDKFTSSNDNNIDHISFDRQRLIYKGHALKNKDTIFQSNIKDAHCIHLVPQKSKPSTNNNDNQSQVESKQQPQQQQENKEETKQQIIDHLPYKNVICPKCARDMVLTQPMLCYASFLSQRSANNQQLTIKQIVNACNTARNNENGNNDNNNNNNNNDNIPPNFDEKEHGASCDMRREGCSTPDIRSNDYCYHCPNKRAHPFGYDLCLNCARYVDNPFINLNIAVNHVLKYQLNMFADIFYDRYRILIDRAIGGQLNNDEVKQESDENKSQQQQQQQQAQRQGQRAVQRGTAPRGRPQQQQQLTERQRQQQMARATVRMNGIDYIKVIDEEGNILLIPKSKIEAIERAEKPFTINDLKQIVCNSNSEFRKRVSAVIADPRLIREIFQKECPNLLRDNVWIRKFLSEAFEHIECRIYIQARMALNLQDIIQTVNDIVNEQAVIRNNMQQLNNVKILKQTFKIIKASSSQWVNDDKRKNCVSCGSSFGMFSRKHHCKACGDIFCSKHCMEILCRPNKQLMPNRNVTNLKIRLCDECKTKYRYYSYVTVPQSQ